MGNGASTSSVKSSVRPEGRTWAKPCVILFACCTLVATTYSEQILNFLNRFPSIYSFCFFALLFGLLLPPRFLVLSIPLAIGALTGVGRVNEAKISAVSLPVTSFDVTAVLEDPMVFLNAVGIGKEAYKAILIGVIATSIVLLASYVLWRGARGHRLNPSVATSLTWTTLTLNALMIVVIVAAAYVSIARYGKFVHANLISKESELWSELWLPSGQVALSRKLGVLEYLGFSAFAAGERPDAPDQSGGPEIEDVRRAASEFVNVPRTSQRGPLPNIVFFHAESSFDPHLAFKLSSRVALPLWSEVVDTRALGPLRVNVVGGGSWVTEFEVITGVDSRIFGYQGFYTHYYLAPKVRNSFAWYLARKGYTTRAYYPVEGAFYNVAKAFRSYGFGEFRDGAALRLPTDWANLVDRDIVRSVIDLGGLEGPGPFFSFIGTAENHGPHPCKHFVNERQFVTTFVEAASFDENCQLNEYLKRAVSTSDALVLVLQRLKHVQKTTGRPFVLLVYGDHQPWSFTGGRYSIAGGTAAEKGSSGRMTADGYQTFFHLLASDDTILKKPFTSPPPASLLPTMISAFVAGFSEDLYLPINFLAFASCGSDIRTSGCDRRAQIANALRTFLLTEPAAVPPPVIEEKQMGSNRTRPTPRRRPRPRCCVR
jgi:phosphoglycerol transferase MdoB-like AlkP superfamily enzyme